MRSRRRLILAVVLATWGAGVVAAPVHAAARPAQARRAKAAPAAEAPKALPPEELEKLGAQLNGEDEGAAMTAMKQLGDSMAPNAHGPLEQLLAVGTVPTVAVEAINVLQKLKPPSSIQILILYSGNHNIPVRLAAVRALGAITEERVVGTLLERLGDNASEVRAAAADALAARKETRASARLFLLVSRSDPGAAGPLGLLIAPDQIPRVAELYGRVENPVLAAVFGEFIKRSEVPDRLRLDVVRTLGRLPGAAATTALVEYLSVVPDNDTRPSKDEAQRIIQQILEQRGKP